MPQPEENQIPDRESWNIVHKNVSDEELLALASNLVKFDGQPYEENRADILDFLGDTEESRIQRWTDYWVTIIQMLGLAYIVPGDPTLFTTELAKDLNKRKNIDAFFLYWALRFQFPFAYNKHSDWKEHGKVVQPYISLLEHLVELYRIGLSKGSPNLDDLYLTFEEIILIIMKSRFDNIYDIKANVQEIIENRTNGFDYSGLKIQGYESIENNFRSRMRLYFERIPIIQFDQENLRVVLSSAEKLLAAITFLSYRSPNILVVDDPTRKEYFDIAFENLRPSPTHLSNAVESSLSIGDFDPFDHDIGTQIHNYLANRGLTYPPELVQSLLLCLRTKPFVIFSGVSGTGKTRLPREIMRMVQNSNCPPIAVAPDWTDNMDMLGYFNIQEEFVTGEFTTLLKVAIQNPHKPYFVILDEMNLARVEYYFAQVLSVLESREFDDELNRVVMRDFLFNKAILERLEKNPDDEVKKYSKLKIPPNVYIIGTVNIDETTFPFSKKVLDRANVIEIDQVDLSSGIIGTPISGTNEQFLNIPDFFFHGNLTNLNDLKIELERNESPALTIDLFQEWVTLLEQFNSILQPLKLNFGYRVRDEVCIYLYHSAYMNPDELNTETWWHKYFDQQLVQKVLTKLSGEQGLIELYLIQLLELCGGGLIDLSEQQMLEIDLSSLSADDIRFPKTARKLQRMLETTVKLDQPSTSFWTA